MSKLLTPQFTHPQGALAYSENREILLAAGTTVPADAGSGFSPGCLFFHTDGTLDTVLYVNDGTSSSCDFNAIPSAIGVTSAQLSAELASGAGVGVTAGTGTVYETALRKVGGIYHTTIMIDVTGLGTSTTDLDVIGVAGGGCHLGQITAAECGTILAVRMTCLELPATGADDIILYSADESTLAFDSAISAATNETVIIDPAAAWANGTVKGATTVPAANQYLYLVNGEAGTVGTYTAGKFLIELFGYDA
jgi:hypothetical protein